MFGSSLLTSIFLPISFITIILVVFAYLVFKYFTYTTPNPDAKIRLSDKDPNHKLKGYKRQDLSIHELRNYDGKHEETNNVIFVAVNGYIFDVTVDRHLYGPGGHYFALAGRDASRALSKFTISCDAIPTDDDLMSDFTSAEESKLNEWYGQFCDRYQCVGRLIRSTQERFTYDHTDDELADESEDNFDNEIDKYCGIQSEVVSAPNDLACSPIAVVDSTTTEQRDCSSDLYNKPLLNELRCENRLSKSSQHGLEISNFENLLAGENSSRSSSLSNDCDRKPSENNIVKRAHSSSSHSIHNSSDLIKQ